MRFLAIQFGLIEHEFMVEGVEFLGREAMRGGFKPDFKQQLVQSLVKTSKEFSGRTISAHSLLPAQARAMGLDPTGGKAFGLMKSWQQAPMILPTPAKQYKLLCLDPTQVPASPHFAYKALNTKDTLHIKH